MPKEIKAELDNVRSISALAFVTVYNWVNEFKRDRTSTCVPVGTIEVAMSEIIDKVHDIVFTESKNRWVKVRELVEVTGLSHGTVILRTIGYEKGSKMGVAFVHCGP